MSGPKRLSAGSCHARWNAERSSKCSAASACWRSAGVEIGPTAAVIQCSAPVDTHLHGAVDDHRQCTLGVEAHVAGEADHGIEERGRRELVLRCLERRHLAGLRGSG